MLTRLASRAVQLPGNFFRTKQKWKVSIFSKHLFLFGNFLRLFLQNFEKMDNDFGKKSNN